MWLCRSSSTHTNSTAEPGKAGSAWVRCRGAASPRCRRCMHSRNGRTCWRTTAAVRAATNQASSAASFPAACQSFAAAANAAAVTGLAPSVRSRALRWKVHRKRMSRPAVSSSSAPRSRSCCASSAASSACTAAPHRRSAATSSPRNWAAARGSAACIASLSVPPPRAMRATAWLSPRLAASCMGQPTQVLSGVESARMRSSPALPCSRACCRRCWQAASRGVWPWEFKEVKEAPRRVRRHAS